MENNKFACICRSYPDYESMQNDMHARFMFHCYENGKIREMNIKPGQSPRVMGVWINAGVYLVFTPSEDMSDFNNIISKQKELIK